MQLIKIAKARYRICWLLGVCACISTGRKYALNNDMNFNKLKNFELWVWPLDACETIYGETHG